MILMTATRDRLYSDFDHAAGLVAKLKARDDDWTYVLVATENGASTVYSIEVFAGEDLIGYL